MSGHSIRIVCAGICLVGCGAGLPRPAVLESVEPAIVLAGAPADLILHGRGFRVRVKADFDDPRQSDVDPAYSVNLAATGGAEIALVDVRRLDDTRIAVALPPGVPPGVYPIRVIDPWGRPAEGEVSLLAQDGSVEPPPAPRACSSSADCDDGISCTTDECTSAGWCSTRWACGAVDVKACFTVSPLVGNAETTFTFDASCSVVPQNGTVAFDFDGNGVFEVPHGAARTASFRYAPGTYEPVVEVRSALGAVERAQRRVVVVPDGDLVLVTTAADEDNVGATTGAPGGTGLSLREAIRIVSATTAPKVIAFAAPMTIDASAPLPALVPSNARIVGRPGVVLNFARSPALAGACLTLAGTQQQLIGVEVRDCLAPGAAVTGADSEILDCTFRSTTRLGAAARFAARGRFGPRNLVTGYDDDFPVTVAAADVMIRENRFTQSRGAVQLHTGALRGVIELNDLDVVVDNVIRVAGGASVNIRHNTFHQISGIAVAAETSTLGGEISVRGNILTGTPCSISGPAARFAQLQPNLLAPSQSSCLGAVAGGGNLIGNAAFVDAAAGDFRLLPGSEGINASIDLGIDLNGTMPRGFNGTAPDFGAHESPY